MWHWGCGSSGTAWHCIALCRTALHCTARHCRAWHRATGCPAGIPTPPHVSPTSYYPTAPHHSQAPCASPFYLSHATNAPRAPCTPHKHHKPYAPRTPCASHRPLGHPLTPHPPHMPHASHAPVYPTTPCPPHALCPPCPPGAPQPPPGQPSVAGQGLWRWLCPEQPRPPSWGVGLLHWREASWVPAWQPGEQGDHGPQGLQPPSTRHPGSARHCSVPALHVLGDREQGEGGPTCHPCAPGWSHRSSIGGWVWGWGLSPVLAVSLQGLTRLQLPHGDGPVLLPDAPILRGSCGGAQAHIT